MSVDDVMSELVGRALEALRNAAQRAVAVGVMTREQFLRWAAEEFDKAQARAYDLLEPPPNLELVKDLDLKRTVFCLTASPCTHGCSLYRCYRPEFDRFDFFWTCGIWSSIAAATFEVPRL